ERLALARSHRVQVAHEAHEALDVGSAKLLVRAGEAAELAQVRVAPAPVPLRENGEVVVVLADDLLQQPLQAEPRRERGQPLVALAERAYEPVVLRRQASRRAVLQPAEQRPPA